jgi:hypothetical protein
MPASTPLASRIESKIVICPATGCHLWTGALSSQGKYPTIGDGPATLYVHRLAAGPQPRFPHPDGSRWEVHHICHRRTCVNPNHVQWMSHRDHMTLHASTRRMLNVRPRRRAKKVAA